MFADSYRAFTGGGAEDAGDSHCSNAQGIRDEAIPERPADLGVGEMLSTSPTSRARAATGSAGQVAGLMTLGAGGEPTVTEVRFQIGTRTTTAFRSSDRNQHCAWREGCIHFRVSAGG